MTTKAPGASSASPLLSSILYEPFGPVTGLTYGNGIAETRSFDLDYRLTNLNASGSAAVQKLGYGYDAANNVLSITDGVTSSNTQHFGYDVLNRLTSATGVYGSLGYTYDANGNRLTENPMSSAAPALDGLGTVTTAIYNDAGRLATVNAGTQQLAQYTYDAFGHRSVKLGTLTPLTIYQYGQGGELLEENSTTAGTQTDYIYLQGRPVAEINAGKVYFLHDDRLGTPQVATNSSQVVMWVGDYLPFGELSAASQTALLGQDLRLPGQENDAETGLYHNGFRDYSPGLGRYTQSDPVGLAGGPNAYLYGLANPVANVDVTGLNVTVYIYPDQVSGLGHIGLGVGSDASEGFYPINRSWLNDAEIVAGESTPGTIGLDMGDYNSFTITTSAAQDQLIRNYISQRYHNPGNYNFYTNQCTAFVSQALQAAGLEVPSDTLDMDPDIFYNDLVRMYSSETSLQLFPPLLNVTLPPNELP